MQSRETRCLCVFVDENAPTYQLDMIVINNVACYLFVFSLFINTMIEYAARNRIAHAESHSRDWTAEIFPFDASGAKAK